MSVNAIRWGDDEKATDVDAMHVIIAVRGSWAKWIPQTNRWYETLIDLLLAGF